MSTKDKIAQCLKSKVVRVSSINLQQLRALQLFHFVVILTGNEKAKVSFKKLEGERKMLYPMNKPRPKIGRLTYWNESTLVGTVVDADGISYGIDAASFKELPPNKMLAKQTLIEFSVPKVIKYMPNPEGPKKFRTLVKRVAWCSLFYL